MGTALCKALGSLVLQEVPDAPAGCDPPRLPKAAPARNSGKLPQGQGQARLQTPGRAAGLALPRRPPAPPSVRPNRRGKGWGGGGYRARGGPRSPLKALSSGSFPAMGSSPRPGGREPGTGNGPRPGSGAAGPAAGGGGVNPPGSHPSASAAACGHVRTDTAVRAQPYIYIYTHTPLHTCIQL